MAIPAGLRQLGLTGSFIGLGIPDDIPWWELRCPFEGMIARVKANGSAPFLVRTKRTIPG
jgi:hypothetical protein